MAAHYKRHHRNHQKLPMGRYRAAMDHIRKRKYRIKNGRKPNEKVLCYGIIQFKRWNIVHWNRWNWCEHTAKSQYILLFTSEIFVCVFSGAHIKLIGFDCLFHRTLENKLAIAIFVAVIAVFSTLYHIPGNHQALVTVIRTNLWFVVYWVGLGVLSSVGLGTGLHTFLLYLGPHIASVTLAAYECNSLNFPSPPYPDE